MQKIALAVILTVVFTTCITAQTVLFSEDFENTSSISLTSSGTPGWNINSRLQAGGNYSDSANCNTGGDSSVLTSSFFSTTGNTYILLEFDHICKIEFFDAGYIEVSNDSGQTWARATGSHYLGAGQFASVGNKFTSTSYNSWLPGNPSTPLNSWWKHELFDISALASNSQYVAIRFILKDENAQTVFDNHGWFLDNIIIQGALSELTPPNITLSPPVQQGIVFSLGPFPITAYITDTSGIDTAFIVYRVNNGSPDTVGMNLIGTDTFRGYLPPVNDLDSINYHIIAIDASASNNTAQHPAIGTLSFIASSGLYLPYYNNFEIQDTLWEPTTTDPLTQWEWGTPNYGLLTGAHSGVHAWTVNKDSAYSNNVDAILTSPFFNFSQATDMVLSFWQNRNTESTWDGAHLEITTDGVTWNYLGGLNDPNGINWYTDTVYASGGLPAWEGSSGGWIKSEYNLSLFNNQPMVRFRFVFRADPYVSYEGMSIDDFRISPGVNKDAGIVAVTNPVSGCNLNFQPVITAVKNYGIDTIFGNMMLAYQIGNNTPVIETFTDTLSPNDTGFFSFNTMADLSTASSTDSVFTIKVFSMLTGDTIYDNDTLSLQIISGTGPADPAVQHQNIPYATATVVTAISSDTLYWYNSSTAVGPIHIGSSYATPVLYDSTTYFVEARKGIGNVKFTEITLESTGAGSSNPYPAYIPPTTQWDGVEITNTGASAIDLTGYRFIMEGYKSINYTLPQGLVLWPGDVLVLTIYSFPLLTDDTLHNMFVAGNQSVYSTSQLGFWLEAPDGAIADAVATNGYSFGTGSQVTPSDWSGAIPSAVGKAGVIRVINDNNNASDWVLSDIPQPVQTIGAFNPALPYPTSLGCPGNRLPLNVTIFGKPDHDAGVIELLTPRTDSMLTNAEPVTMVVKNFGNLAIQNIPVGYQLDNNIPVVDTIAATIQPGDTLHFTFSSKADLSAFAIYQFTCFTNLATDTILINDTLTEQVIHNLPTYCPSSANYTSLIDIGHFSYGDINNPSPTGAKTYTDFTSLPIKGFKKGIPYPISITQQPQGTSIYTCAFEVYVDLNKDGIFDKTTESIFSGVTNSTAQTVSGFAAIPASASTGLTRMRVVLMYGSSIANVNPCGTYNYGETEDYNIEILPPSQYDATITGISGFTPPVIEGLPLPLSIYIKNVGLQPISNIPVGYTTDQLTYHTDTLSATINPGDSMLFTFSQNIIPPNGIFTLEVYAALPGDGYIFNDTLSALYLGEKEFVIFYKDNFEGDDDNGWVSEHAGVWQHGKPSMNIINHAYSGTKVWATRLYSNYTNNANAGVRTPAFDFNDLHSLTIRFWHWYETEYGADGGNMKYSVDGGNVWLTLGYITDPLGVNWYNHLANGKYSFTGSSGAWSYSSYNISAYDDYPTPVQFKFDFFSNYSGVFNGWAIDDFMITVEKDSIDAGVIDIVMPNSPVPVGNPVQVSVKMKNFGKQTLSSVPLKYSINGGIFVNEIWTGSLMPGATLIYTFTATSISPGHMDITAMTTLPNDRYAFNDTCKVTIGNPSGIEQGGIIPVNVYPVPAEDKLWIDLSLPSAMRMQIKIFDITGKTVFKKYFDLAQGENKVMLDINALEQGLYYLLIENEHVRMTKKITLLK